MSAKDRLLARGGIRSFRKTFDDGGEETFHYKARTPAEIAALGGAIEAFPSGENGSVARDRYMGKFLVGAMCNEDGSSLLSEEDVARIPPGLKLTLVNMIVAGSSETGDAGKG